MKIDLASCDCCLTDYLSVGSRNAQRSVAAAFAALQARHAVTGNAAMATAVKSVVVIRAIIAAILVKAAAKGPAVVQARPAVTGSATILRRRNVVTA